jgi:type II secretory pathway component GspD/PulD (secretin)/tetratricopeptide (TPR) repeat protein
MKNVGIALSLSIAATGACSSPSTGGDPALNIATPAATNQTATNQTADQQDASGGGATLVGNALLSEGVEPTAVPVAQDQTLNDEWAKLSLKEQKKRLLVDQHLTNADAFLAKLMLAEAEAECLGALEVDADNATAKAKLAEIRSLMGRPSAELATIQQELARGYDLRVQQLRLDTEESIKKGKLMMSRGEYDAAITELSLALDRVRWAPYALDWKGLDKQAEGLLEQARRERESAGQALAAKAQQKAYEQLKVAEQVEADRKQAMVDEMVGQAIEAFDAGDYDAAMKFADEALAEDPNNEKASDVRDTSFRAGRRRANDTYLRQKKELFQSWREEMEELRVTYTDIITPPDADYWQKITALRAKRTGFSAESEVPGAEAALIAKMREKPIPGFRITGEGNLQTVVATLRTWTDLPLVVDPTAAAAAADAGVTFEFNLTSPLTVDKALNLICQQAGENVTWTIKHDAILVTTKEKAMGELELRSHAVQDLIFGLTDFMGPRINRIRLLDENTDEDGGGPFAAIGEKHIIIEPDELANLVKDNVAVGSWEGDGVSLEVQMGNMIVRHRADVQRRVWQFLEDLRRFTNSMVTIESKFLTVEENWLQEIGIDFRGLDNPGDPFTDLDDVTNGLEDQASNGLDNGGSGSNNSNAAGPPSAGFFYDDGADGDFKGHTENIFNSALGKTLSNLGGITAQWTFLNDLQISTILRAVEKSSNVEVVNEQVVSVHNTQRAYVTVINQRAYIQDFDVEVATAQAVADPQINVLSEGIVLDVRPTIHHDRHYLTLEIQPTVAKIVSIDLFSTALGGQTTPVQLQLPELEVKSVFTTAVVPDGGSILLGGLSRVRNIERRSEVPWLANIPLVGFFFKKEGYNDEKSGLMIMLRAWITDVKDTVE